MLTRGASEEDRHFVGGHVDDVALFLRKCWDWDAFTCICIVSFLYSSARTLSRALCPVTKQADSDSL